MSTENTINNKTKIPKKSLLDRLRNKITPYILSLSILAGAYFIDLPKSYPADYKGEREWMLRPMSARGAGMGNGLVALLDGANTVFWNPAGLAFINGIGFSHTYYNQLVDITDIRNENTSFNTMIKGAFTIGLNISYYYNHNRYIESTLEDYNLGISMGYKVKNIGFGINIKHLFSDANKNIHYSKERTFAVDIGVLIPRGYNIKHNYSLDINVAASMINIGKDLKVEIERPYEWIETGLPKLFKVGYAATFNLPKKNVKLNPFSITHNLEYSEIINFRKYIKNQGYRFLGYGLEVILYEMFSFRIGNRSLKSKKYYADMPDIGFSYGFGLNFPVNYFYKKIPLSIKYDYARFPFHPKSNIKEIRYYIKEIRYYKINSFSIQYMF